jgi:hypothetical protein
VLAGLGGLARGDLAAGRRSWAIVEGLLLTSVAYAAARARLRTSSEVPAGVHADPAERRSGIDTDGVVDQGQRL